MWGVMTPKKDLGSCQLDSQFLTQGGSIGSVQDTYQSNLAFGAGHRSCESKSHCPPTSWAVSVAAEESQPRPRLARGCAPARARRTVPVSFQGSFDIRSVERKDSPQEAILLPQEVGALAPSRSQEGQQCSRMSPCPP